MNEWIFRNESKFVSQADLWDQILRKQNNVTAFVWDAAATENTLAAIESYKENRAAFVENDNTRNRTAKNLARDAAVKAMRAFAAAYVRYNPLVDEATRRELGLPPADKIRTPAPRPPFAPATAVETTHTHHEHKVTAINPVTETPRKPAGVKGVIVAWQVGGEKPASPDDMPKSQSCAGSLTISHGEKNAGKTVYYATCYENSRHERGEWSLIVEMGI